MTRPVSRSQVLVARLVILLIIAFAIVDLIMFGFSAEERARFDEGLIATSRIILLGLVMGIIYQVIVFKTFFPGEAVIFALALAFVPYVILRGLFARGMPWWAGRQKDLA